MLTKIPQMQNIDQSRVTHQEVPHVSALEARTEILIHVQVENVRRERSTNVEVVLSEVVPEIEIVARRRVENQEKTEEINSVKIF